MNKNQRKTYNARLVTNLDVISVRNSCSPRGYDIIATRSCHVELEEQIEPIRIETKHIDMLESYDKPY